MKKSTIFLTFAISLAIGTTIFMLGMFMNCAPSKINFVLIDLLSLVGYLGAIAYLKLYKAEKEGRWYE